MCQHNLKQVLFYGDSNTYGYDPTGFFGGRYDETVRWTERVRVRFADTWNVFVDGQNGRQIPRHQTDFALLDRSIQSACPLTLFAVMLGTNDYFSISSSQEASKAERVAARMEAMVRHLLSSDRFQSDGTKLLLIAPPKMLVTDDFFFGPVSTEDEENGMSDLSYEYLQIAKRYDLLFADAAAWDLPMSYDGVHLSAEGHAAFAEEMTAFLSDENLFTCGDLPAAHDSTRDPQQGAGAPQ